MAKTVPLRILHDGGFSPCADLVAVHGLGSNPNTTWNFKKVPNTKPPMWLDDFLPRDFPTTRIMTFNHNSKWARDANSKSLEDHGNDLLLELRLHRQEQTEQERPIIFIGHSFGGVVVKEAFVSAANPKAKTPQSPIVACAEGFVFLSTPHRGSRYSFVAKTWALFFSVLGASRELPEAISINSTQTEKTHDLFVQNVNLREKVVCFYETKYPKFWSITLPQVVSRSSATIEGAEAHGFEANHQNMQRFESAEDPDYLKIKFYIQQFVENSKRSSANIHQVRSSPPEIISVGPPRPSPYFHGREDILKYLHEELHPGRPGEAAEMKVCVLSGLGGTGKTQIARRYMALHEKDHKHCFWVRAEEPTQIVNDYGRIASVFDVTFKPDEHNQQRNVEVAKAQLSSEKEPWLLIFDNVVTPEDVRGYIPSNTKGSVIITTQNSEVARMYPTRKTVERLDENDGPQLLLRYLDPEDRSRAGFQDDMGDAEAISQLVGGLPLAIAMVAGVIAGGSWQLSQFLQDFHDSSEVLNTSASYSFTEGISLARVFDQALNHLDRQGPRPRRLLNCLAFMNPDTIQEEMIFNIDSEHSKNILEFDHTSITQQKNKLRGSLQEMHLAELVASPRHEFSEIGIHREVQSSLRRKLKENTSEFRASFLNAFRLIRDVVPRQSPVSAPSTDDWATYERYLPHVLSLHTAYKKAWNDLSPYQDRVFLDFAELLSDVGNYMYERYLVPNALAVLGTAADIYSKLLESGNLEPLRIQVLYLQASIELNHGSVKRREALKKKIHIVQLREKRNKEFCRDTAETKPSDESGSDVHGKGKALTYFPQNHWFASIQLSTSLNNLACAYMHCDDFERAAPLLKKSKRIKDKWKSTERPQIAGFAEVRKNLALISLSRGEVSEAVKFSREAADMMNNWSKTGSRTKVVQFFRFMHACVLFNIGEEKRALEENVEILKVREDVLGTAHDHTIDSYYAVGMMYSSTGNLTAAGHHLTKALELRTGYYETRIPRILHCLSEVYSREGRLEESKNLREEARGLFTGLVPEDCPGVDVTESDFVRYDQIVNIWSGRFTGKLNLGWQNNRAQ